MSPRSSHERVPQPPRHSTSSASPRAVAASRPATYGCPGTNFERSIHVAVDAADLAGLAASARAAGNRAARAAPPCGFDLPNVQDLRSARQGASLGAHGQGVAEGAGRPRLAPSTFCDAAAWMDTLSVTVRALGRDLKSCAGREAQDRCSRYQARPASQRVLPHRAFERRARSLPASICAGLSLRWSHLPSCMHRAPRGGR